MLVTVEIQGSCLEYDIDNSHDDVVTDFLYALQKLSQLEKRKPSDES